MQKRWAFTLLARSPFSRVLVGGVSLLCTAGIYFADASMPRTSLAPLVTIPVIAMTYACGARAGLVFSVVTGIAFGTIDHPLQDVWLNSIVLTASFGIVVLVFNAARSLHTRAVAVESEVDRAKTVHDTFFVNVNLGASHWRPYIIHVPLREMGGDFYALDLSDSQSGLFVADVSGKGIQASMLHSALKTLLRADDSEDPGDTLTFLNQHLLTVCANGMFCSAWYGRPQSDGIVRFANAGHERPFVQRAGGELQLLDAGQIVLGFGPETKYVSSTVQLRPGDKLLVYTDGLTDLLDRGVLSVQQLFDDFENARHIIAKSRRRDDVLAIRLDYEPAAVPPQPDSGKWLGSGQIFV
jgi:hypothetical protein